MNYLDRNNIAAARLAGLETDLNMTSTQYQTSVSILFVGYLLMQSTCIHEHPEKKKKEKARGFKKKHV